MTQATLFTESIDSRSNWSVFQNSVYIGINIQNILYGIELLLYFKTIRILLTNGGACKKPNVFYAFFSTIMVFFVTVHITNKAIFCEKMWLVDSGFPEGAYGYWKAHISDWYMDWGKTGVVCLQLMTDALMIYRCRIIWNSYRVIIIPFILWLATLALGVLVEYTTSLPKGDFYSGLALQLGFAYYTTSVFLNTILTCMICYRIMRHGRAIREHLGHEYASLYFAVVTIVIESVVPYTLSGIAFLVSLGMGSPISAAFASVYVLMMCISPQMLILRVIAGRAWDKDTFNPPGSTVRFSAGGTSGFDSSRPKVHLETLSSVYLPDGHCKV